MDRIATIARCQWRAFWRRFRRAGTLSAGNQGIILILAVLLLARYLQSLRVAANDLSRGNSRLFESLLLGIFLVWLFPLAGSARQSIASRKLKHFPLTLKELFAIRVVTLFVQPVPWFILGGSLAICYPVIRAHHRVAGVIASLLFILFSAFVGLTIAHLLTLNAWRRLFFLFLLLVGFGVTYLINKNGLTYVLLLTSWLPGTLVSRAALGNQSGVALIELVLLTASAFFVALWSFKKSLEATPSRRTQKFSLFNSLLVPGPIGGLAAKDFRHFRRLLDPYLGVLAAALGSFYMLAAEVPSVGVFQLCVLIVFLPNSPLAFNAFGLDDRAGLDRLRLMPVTGKNILLSKNVAFLMVVGVQLLPLILLAAWKLGIVASLLGIFEAAALAAAYLIWGNWMSLSHPVKMQFFQFSNSNGLIVEAIAGLMLGSLPGMVVIYLYQTEGRGSLWKTVLVLLVTLGLYVVSLSRLSARFEQRQHRILNAIS